MENHTYNLCCIILAYLIFLPVSNNGFHINSNISANKNIARVKQRIINRRYTSEENPPCNELLSVPIKEFEKFENGSILSLDVHKMLYPPEMYWKAIDDEGNEQIRGCLCLLTTCIRKCCPENVLEATISRKGKCVSSISELPHPFEPEFSETPTNDIKILYGNPCKYGSYRINPFDQDYPEEFKLHSNGILSTNEGDFTAAEYCLEVFEDQERILPLLCFPPEENEY